MKRTLTISEMVEMIEGRTFVDRRGNTITLPDPSTTFEGHIVNVVGCTDSQFIMTEGRWMHYKRYQIQQTLDGMEGTHEEIQAALEALVKLHGDIEFFAFNPNAKDIHATLTFGHETQ